MYNAWCVEMRLHHDIPVAPCCRPELLFDHSEGCFGPCNFQLLITTPLKFHMDHGTWKSVHENLLFRFGNYHNQVPMGIQSYSQFSTDHWGVQSPPQQSIRVPSRVSEGDWIYKGPRDHETLGVKAHQTKHCSGLNTSKQIKWWTLRAAGADWTEGMEEQKSWVWDSSMLGRKSQTYSAKWCPDTQCMVYLPTLG